VNAVLFAHGLIPQPRVFNASCIRTDGVLPRVDTCVRPHGREAHQYGYEFFIFYFFSPFTRALVASAWTHECVRVDVGPVRADAEKRN
jgi:hypothetical protein